MIQSPWAVLLCKFKDDTSEPYGRQRYEDLFTSSGADKMNMVTFFRDMSHGVLDLSGSQVFGWFTIDKNRSEYAGSGINQQGRADLIAWASQAAITDNKDLDLSKFFSVVVCMNVETDLFGGGAGVVCDDGRASNGMSGLSPSFLGQEMGHTYGLSHSRADGSTADYKDDWDVMSVASTPFMAPHPYFTDVDMRANRVFRLGPGLNAANMASRQWLDESRVWTTSTDQHVDTVLQLRPLHRRDLPGYLAARLGKYFIEFRNGEGWDAAMTTPVVLIHRLEDNISYLMSANDGRQDLVAGSVFGTADPTIPVISVERVEVVEINPNEHFAKVRLTLRPGFEEPSLGPGVVFGGITKGGGGFIFVGGKLTPVLPRSPLVQILEQAATYENSASITSVQLRNAVRRESLSAIVALAEDHIQKMQVFQQPAPPFQKEERDEMLNQYGNNVRSEKREQKKL